MTSTPPIPASSEAHREASRWAARLDRGVMTTADRARLERWLEAAPEHRPLLSRYCQLSANLETIMPGLLQAGALEVPAPAAVAPFRWTRLALPLAAAAALAVTAWFGHRELTRPGVQEITTLARERSTLTLADGSQLDLNARTHATVRYDGQRRLVRLLEGEALFAVTKNPEQPFVVATAAGEVTVTGTRFNVRLEEGGPLEVTVLEGSVRVRPPGPSAGMTYSLQPGDQLQLLGQTGKIRHLPEEEAAEAALWRDGAVLFEHTPLPDAVARFARYHEAVIEVDPALRTELIGGRHALDDLPGFLASLEVALKVRVVRAPDGTYRILPR